jgi:hypothetical protein
MGLMANPKAQDSCCNPDAKEDRARIDCNGNKDNSEGVQVPVSATCLFFGALTMD